MIAESPILYLTDKRTWFIGGLGGSACAQHAAATLYIGLEAEFHVYNNDKTIDFFCRSLLVPAGDSVCIDADGQVMVCCYLDPFGQDYASLCGQAQQQCNRLFYQLSNENELIKTFSYFYHQQPAIETSYTLLLQVLHSKLSSEPRVIDPRIEKAVILIKSSATANMSVAAIADAVNLSAPHLTQLFKKHIGVPIRRYRQWHRLFIAAVSLSHGMNMTEAALTAGFSDSSHFTNTFRSIIGFNLTQVISSGGPLKIFALVD